MKIRNVLIALAMALCLLLGVLLLLSGRLTPATVAPSQTRYVDDATGNDAGNNCTAQRNPCKTVQHAVDEAGTGAVIKVATGIYTDTIIRTPTVGYTNTPASGVIAQVVYISKTLTIRGGYAAADWAASNPMSNPTTLDAEGEKRVIFAGGEITVTLENLRITGGDATGLGGRSDSGGVVYGIVATVTLRGNDIYSNTAEWGSGVCLDNSDGAVLSDNAIYNNTASQYGGGVGLYRNDGATLSDNDIYSNTATEAGGGIDLYECHDATLRGNDIYSNVADWGGGVYLERSDGATLSGNDIYSNTAPSGGGGYLYHSDDAALSSNDIHNNTADWGGGLYLYAAAIATLNGNDIYSNTANRGGGGNMIYYSHDATLRGNVIYNNTAENDGGGVFLYFSEDATLSGNAIYNNTAKNGDGGGVEVGSYSDNATLSGNTIYDNTGGRYGGGVDLYEAVGVTLDNNVIAANQVITEGSGVHLYDSAALLRHNTIVRNTGGDGSGVHVGITSTVALTNTILVGHTVGITVTNGCTVTLESTLWATGAAWANVTPWVNNGALTHAHDVPGDPAFVDPDNDDYHIGSNSAAIDEGVDAGVTTDIDGDTRPTGPGYDIGADEFKLEND